MDDDVELLRDYVDNRSERAFAALVARHIDLIYSAALRRMDGDQHRAKEVTQMVFIDLARKAPELTRHPLLTGWLHRSTRWAANNLRRAEIRRAAHEQAAAAEWLADDGQAPDWSSVRPILDEALDELREEEREAVLLRYFNNCSYAEIGRRLGTSENATRMRVDRALEKLHGILRRRGLAGGAVALGVALTQNAVVAAPAGLVATVVPAATAVGGVTLTAGGTMFLMSKVTMAVVSAGALTLGALCLHEYNQLKSGRELLSLARAQHATREREVADAAARLAGGRAELAAMLAPPTPPNPLEQERKRLDMIVRKGGLDGAYAPLFLRLKLSPAQLDAFKSLLVERNQSQTDALQLAKEEGVEFASSAELKELKREATREVDARILALTGEQKLNDLLDYSSPWLRKYVLKLDELSAMTSIDLGGWERGRAMAALWERTGAEAEETAWRNNDAMLLPQPFVDGAKALLTESEFHDLQMEQEDMKASVRMAEIARAAAYAGRLKLSEKSKRDYATPTANAINP